MKKGISLLEVLVVIVIVAVIAFVVVPVGLIIPYSKAITALETQGFRNVQVTERKWFMISWRGCGSGDNVLFETIATNSLGKQVSLYVCTGWWKGSTVRTH